MNTYYFTVFLAGDYRGLVLGIAEALYKAGCGDGTVEHRNGVVSVEYDREALSLGYAIGPVVDAIERAGYVVERIEIDSA